MDLIRFVVLIILFRKAKGTDFIFSDVEADWKTASKKCTLATPELMFSSGKTKVEIAGMTDDVWVGYYQAWTTFEYFGCAEKGTYTPRFITKADPGQCLSACGAQMTIGIFKNECFCFKNDEMKTKQTMIPHCDKECKNNDGIVCGGPNEDTDGSSYMSLYRPIGTDIGDGNANHNCRNYGFNGFTWNNCSNDGYNTLCEKDRVFRNKNSIQPYSNWITSTIKCFKKKTRPSTYQKTGVFNIDRQSPLLWTGMVRSLVIYKFANAHTDLNNASTYGYLDTDKDGKIILKFAEFNAQKKFLCEDGSSDVGAIVGATLSIVVVIAVIIGVVLFLRKRGIKLPFFQKEKQTQNTNNVQNNIGYVITRPVEILQSTYHSDQDEYADIDLTTTIDNEHKNDAENGATESSDKAHDYFVLEKVQEEPYDSTKPYDQKSDPNTFNPYNKLSFEKSSNYDHIAAGVRNARTQCMKVSDSENTYNTTFLEDSYAKTSAAVPNNAYNMTEDHEDTYNHTNIPMY